MKDKVTVIVKWDKKKKEIRWELEDGTVLKRCRDDIYKPPLTPEFIFIDEFNFKGERR